MTNLNVRFPRPPPQDFTNAISPIHHAQHPFERRTYFMKVRYFARRLFAFVAVVLAAASLAPNSDAGTVAYMKVGTGDWTALGSAGSYGSLSGFHGSYTVQPIPGTTVSQLLSTNSQIVNSLSTAVDVKFVFVSDGFSSPNTPPAIQMNTVVSVSGLLGTVTTTNTAVHTFVALNDQSGAGVASPFEPKILSAPNLIDGGSLTQGIGTVGSGTTAFGTISSLVGAFTIGQELETHLEAGASLNLSITTTLAPEPGTMSLFAMGILGFGAYGWRGRRQTKATTETTVA